MFVSPCRTLVSIVKARHMYRRHKRRICTIQNVNSQCQSNRAEAPCAQAARCHPVYSKSQNGNPMISSRGRGRGRGRGPPRDTDPTTSTIANRSAVWGHEKQEPDLGRVHRDVLDLHHAAPAASSCAVGLTRPVNVCQHSPRFSSTVRGIKKKKKLTSSPPRPRSR